MAFRARIAERPNMLKLAGEPVGARLERLEPGSTAELYRYARQT